MSSPLVHPRSRSLPAWSAHEPRKGSSALAARWRLRTLFDAGPPGITARAARSVTTRLWAASRAGVPHRCPSASDPEMTLPGRDRCASRRRGTCSTLRIVRSRTFRPASGKMVLQPPGWWRAGCSSGGHSASAVPSAPVRTVRLDQERRPDPQPQPRSESLIHKTPGRQRVLVRPLTGRFQASGPIRSLRRDSRRTT